MANPSPSPSRSLEQAYARLEKVESGITVSEIWITRQLCLIERLRGRGHDIAHAENVFHEMEHVLAGWHEQRHRLLDSLAAQEAS